MTEPDPQRLAKLRRLFRRSAISQEVWQHQNPCESDQRLGESVFFQITGGKSYRVQGKINFTEDKYSMPNADSIIEVHLDDDCKISGVVSRVGEGHEGICAIGPKTNGYIPLVLIEFGHNGEISALIEILAQQTTNSDTATKNANIFAVLDSQVHETVFVRIPNDDPMQQILGEKIADVIIDDALERSRSVDPLTMSNEGMAP